MVTLVEHPQALARLQEQPELRLALAERRRPGAVENSRLAVGRHQQRRQVAEPGH